ETPVFVNYETMTEPDTLALLDLETGALSALKSLPARFDPEGLTVSQFEATSADGTKIPYFVLAPAGQTDPAPALLYGYGGFQISMKPRYSATIGKLWAGNGGVYLLANIRGGGEFGPAWHEAARRENRQKSFDDFIAVADDAAARGLTSPAQLGIMGGSNGGLLTGAVMVQRPDLFGAVISQVPLLDMLRFHKLLAGASWVDEYGNPDDAKEREAILQYSPYQNVSAEADYPPVLFVTSTKDDRVHPGHARKMVARMKEQGHDVLYFEAIEGGHNAAANLKQRAERTAMEFTFLARELGLSLAEPADDAP
ncbi:MAG: prolyl oligopeptidase family serine peptidase, partial [Pseudomonadota bacterium]